MRVFRAKLPKTFLTRHTAPLGLRNFGALTSKPYAFVARPWELHTTDGIDNLNALGANIQLQSRGNELLRVLPRTNDAINEEWIDDKTRFSYDGLRTQRLLRPMVRQLDQNGVSLGNWDRNIADWRDVFKRIKSTLNTIQSSSTESSGLSIRGISGTSSDLHSMLALSDFLETFSSSAVFQSAGSVISNPDIPGEFRFNSTIQGIESSDLCLLVGTNLHVDAPLLVARLRKCFLNDAMSVTEIGPRNALSFPSDQIGLTPETLLQISTGDHPFSAVLKAAQNPMIILDASVFQRDDSTQIAEIVNKLCKDTNLQVSDSEGGLSWNGVNILHRNANDVGALELGLGEPLTTENVATEGSVSDVLVLMNLQAEDLPNGAADVQKLRDSAKFVIYVGSHGDELAGVADVILPTTAFVEKTGLYVNLEGRVQRSNAAVPPPGNSRHEWEIFRGLSEVLGKPLPYDSADELEQRLELFVPSIAGEALGEIVEMPFEIDGVKSLNPKQTVEGGEGEGKQGDLSEPLKPVHYDFHLQGHAVARASKVMATCSKTFQPSESNFL